MICWYKSTPVLISIIDKKLTKFQRKWHTQTSSLTSPLVVHLQGASLWHWPRTPQRLLKTSDNFAPVRKAHKWPSRAHHSTELLLDSWLKVATSQTTMALVERPSTTMVVPSKMRTSLIATQAVVSYPWQMRVLTLTAHSSSSASEQLLISMANIVSLAKLLMEWMCSILLRLTHVAQETSLCRMLLSLIVVNSEWNTSYQKLGLMSRWQSPWTSLTFEFRKTKAS